MGTVPTCEFRYTRARTLQLLQFGISICVLGVPLITTGLSPLTGYVMCAIGCVSVAMLPLAFGGAAVAIDDRGLRVARPGLGLLPWAAIAAVRFVRVDQVAYLVVDRNRVARAQQRAGFLLRRPARRIGADDIAIPLIGLRDDPKRVVEVVALALSIANGTSRQARRRRGAAGRCRKTAHDPRCGAGLTSSCAARRR